MTRIDPDPRARNGHALLFALALIAVAVAPAAQAQSVRLVAPNVVEISPDLVTSGQPSASALAQLASDRFDAVIYLAPPTVADAVKDEQLIVTGQGLVFVNLPIRFDRPTESDFEAFSGVLAGLKGRKVLVHCQVNLRASSMVFLYRTITLKEPPQRAYEALARVWSPEGPWRTFIQAQLRKHAIAYEFL